MASSGYAHSPRYTSTGYYSTSVPMSFSDTDMLVPSCGGELVELSRVIGEGIVTEWFSRLPTKSWVGKKLLDAIVDNCPSPKSASTIADIWTGLIELDRLTTTASARTLTKGSKLHRDDIYNSCQSCWDKILRLMKTIALEVTRSNPSITRSPLFNRQTFMTIVLVHSFEVREHRHQWYRIRNLGAATVSAGSRGGYN
jgi:hypothetical protein